MFYSINITFIALIIAMKKTYLFIILIWFISVSIVQAQEFSTEQQYKQAMDNAKQAFEAQQFSQAVLFYREAMKINPEALLPRYKIEDIRTIYIEIELDSLKSNPELAVNKKEKRKKRKELEAEQVLLAEQAKEEATRKMNADADLAEAELRNLHVDVIDIDDEISFGDLDKSIKVDEVVGNKEVLVEKVEVKQQKKIEGETKKLDQTEIKFEKRKLPVITEKVEKLKESMAIVKETKPIEKQVLDKTRTKELSREQKEAWIEKEKKRLAKVYPNKKTVEEIDKPGKHITRVIMNIDNKVTIFLKVKHSWGATYFFIDEVGQELKSISEQYFNLLTNLETYGD